MYQTGQRYRKFTKIIRKYYVIELNRCFEKENVQYMQKVFRVNNERGKQMKTLGVILPFQ